MIDLTKLKVGDIFFSNDDSWESWMIRFVETRGLVPDLRLVPGHTGVIGAIHCDSSGVHYQIDIVEALFGGVRLANFEKDYVLKPRVRIWTATINDPKNVAEGLAWVYKQIGKKYSWWQIGALFVINLIKILTNTLMRQQLLKWLLNNDQRYICSELNERYARAAGHALVKGNPNIISPYDIFTSKEITITQFQDKQKDII